MRVCVNGGGSFPFDVSFFSLLGDPRLNVPERPPFGCPISTIATLGGKHYLKSPPVANHFARGNQSGKCHRHILPLTSCAKLTMNPPCKSGNPHPQYPHAAMPPKCANALLNLRQGDPRLIHFHSAAFAAVSSPPWQRLQPSLAAMLQTLHNIDHRALPRLCPQRISGVLATPIHASDRMPDSES